VPLERKHKEHQQQRLRLLQQQQSVTRDGLHQVLCMPCVLMLLLRLLLVILLLLLQKDEWLQVSSCMPNSTFASSLWFINAASMCADCCKL